MEFSNYFRFIFALVFVLALIGLLTWLLRRFGLGGGRPRTGNGKRLGVVEALAIDGRRRLVLVRRDDSEHLLVLGPNSETVVETGIPAPQPTAHAAADATPTPGIGVRSFKSLVKEIKGRRGATPAAPNAPNANEEQV